MAAKDGIEANETRVPCRGGPRVGKHTETRAIAELCDCADLSAMTGRQCVQGLVRRVLEDKCKSATGTTSNAIGDSRLNPRLVAGCPAIGICSRRRMNHGSGRISVLRRVGGSNGVVGVGQESSESHGPIATLVGGRKGSVLRAGKMEGERLDAMEFEAQANGLMRWFGGSPLERGRCRG